MPIMNIKGGKVMVNHMADNRILQKDLSIHVTETKRQESSGVAEKQQKNLNDTLSQNEGTKNISEISLPTKEQMKAQQMKAQEKFLEASVKHMAETSKAVSQTDRADLTSSTENNVQDDQRTKQKIDARILELLQNWNPNGDLSMNENLRQLRKLFLSLQEQILSGGDEQIQLELLKDLDALLMSKLKMLLLNQSGDLMNFLGDYGRSGSQSEILSGLFHEISSRDPLVSQWGNLDGSNSQGFLTNFSEQDFSLYEISNAAQARNIDAKSYSNRVPGTSPENSSAQPSLNKEVKHGLSNSSSSKGMIYQKNPQGIRMDINYQNSVHKAEQRATRLNLRSLELQNRLSSTSPQTYTASDIKKAQDFVKYFNRVSPQIDREKLVDTSEEYLGFTAGVMSLKTQTFAEHSGIGKQMASSLEYAVDRFIQSFFLKSSQGLKQTTAYLQNRESTPAYQADDIQKVYFHMTSSFQNTRNAQKAVLDGLQKAYASFKTKQGNPAFQNVSRYQLNRGFFSRAEIAQLDSDLWDGWKALCRDWNGFVQYFRLPDAASLRFNSSLDRNQYLALLLSRGKVSDDLVKEKRHLNRSAIIGGVLTVCGSAVLLAIMYFIG